MKATFPHMGQMNLSAKSLLQELGLEVVEPPPITERTLNLGVKHAPEFACLPLKINIGNYIEALEAGADTIIMVGGCGPCRFGYYGEVQREILKDLDYEFEMVIFEPFQGSWKSFLQQFKFIFKHLSWWKLWSAWKLAWTKCKLIDEATEYTNKMRGYATEPDLVTEIYEDFLNKIEDVHNREGLNSAIVEMKNQILDLEINWQKEPLKVGIVGEIYVVLEPFTNLNLEKKLGNMGVVVDRSIYLSDWISEHLFSSSVDSKEHQKIEAAAEPYLEHFVGGHGLETIGRTVLYNQDGYDGVIQLAPFTCMPEIVAESILPEVSRDLNLPVLSLTLDEHTGEAGYITRLEAFVDLLERKQKLKSGGQVI